MQNKVINGVMLILSFPYLLFHYTLIGIFFLFYLLFILFKYIGLGVSLPFLLLSKKVEKGPKQPKEKKAIIKKEKEPKKDNKAEKIQDDKLEIQDKKALEKEQREKEKYEKQMAEIQKKKEKKLEIEKAKLAKIEEKRKKEEEEKLKQEKQEEIKEQQALLKAEKEKKFFEKRQIEKEFIAKKEVPKTKEQLKKEERKKLKEEARQRKEELKREKKKLREKDTYINENVKIEKKKLGDHINDGLEKLISVPKKIYENEKKKIKNNAILKNKRNEALMQKESLLIDFNGEDAKKSDKKVVYEYVGKSADGKIVKAYFEAFSKVEVHSFLLSEGFEVYSIKTNSLIQLLHSNTKSKKGKFKTKDLVFFLAQLSTYIKAGIPLVESLRILSRQFKEKEYEKIFRSLIYELTMGDNFSDAMAKQGEAFPRILVNMVKASEMTGDLPETLDDMQLYFSEMEKTKKQMITALTYPMLIMVLACAALIFIMVYIVPQFVTIYEDMDNAELPWITVFVLNLSNFLQTQWVKIILVVVGTISLFLWLFKNVRLFKTMVQWFLMKLPIIGEVIIFNEVTNFTKTFASLLRHNVFITDSMEILNKITNNEIWKMIILDTITNLAKGDKISLAFQDHWAVPIPAYEMIVTGERTGQLPEMMQKVSDYYQEMHKNQVGRIKAFVEPILIIFLTGAVGLIVMSIIIPMFGMYSSLS